MAWPPPCLNHSEMWSTDSFRLLGENVEEKSGPQDKKPQRRDRRPLSLSLWTERRWDPRSIAWGVGVDFFLPGDSFALDLGEGYHFMEQATPRCTALLVAVDFAIVASRKGNVVQEKVASRA